MILLHCKVICYSLHSLLCSPQAILQLCCFLQQYGQCAIQGFSWLVIENMVYPLFLLITSAGIQSVTYVPVLPSFFQIFPGYFAALSIALREHPLQGNIDIFYKPGQGTQQCFRNEVTNSTSLKFLVWLCSVHYQPVHIALMFHQRAASLGQQPIGFTILTIHFILAFILHIEVPEYRCQNII